MHSLDVGVIHSDRLSFHSACVTLEPTIPYSFSSQESWKSVRKQEYAALLRDGKGRLVEYLVRLVGAESEALGQLDIYEPATREIYVSEAHPDFATAFMELLGEIEGVLDVDASQAGVMTVRVSLDQLEAMHTQLLAVVRLAERMAATSKR